MYQPEPFEATPIMFNFTLVSVLGHFKRTALEGCTNGIGWRPEVVCRRRICWPPVCSVERDDAGVQARERSWNLQKGLLSTIEVKRAVE